MKNSQIRTAKAVNGSEIQVHLVPDLRKQNLPKGFRWVEVGQKILLDNGALIDMNLDGQSFYTAPNQMYRLV